MDMATTRATWQNQHLAHRPACPGADTSHPEAPQHDPLAPGPSPCPHLPVNCRPTSDRTRCGHAHSTTTPADQHPPEPPDRASTRPSVPRTPQARPRASSARKSPPQHAPVPPAPPPDPPHHPLPSMPLPAYKTCPLASTLHHTTTTTPPFHPAAAEEQPELETELFSHRAVTPPWCVSGDATAT